ncbi:MAG: hypothetical protein ACXABK_07490 [Candidatus Heimdallarchaeaceae archaeon]|jgi:hypothetical protein
MKEKSLEIEILRDIVHPIRRGIIFSIGSGSQNFSNIMVDCGLDPGSETGIFLYHLSKLKEKRIVEKNRDGYSLSKLGITALRLLQSLPHLESSYSREGGEIVKESVPRISIKPAEGDLIINKWDFKPGESRLYKESGFVSPDLFGRSFYIKDCLGIVEIPNEPKVLMVKHETYKEKYRGTDANKIRIHVKDGFYLDMREYDTLSIREDGVYILWTSVWGPNYESEKPEETIYKPPTKYDAKIDDQNCGQKTEGRYLNSFHNKVIGKSIVNIDGRKFNCLLKQTHQTWKKEKEIEISRVSQRYVTNDFVDILIRAYHAPTQKRKWILESVKDWEKNPSIDCCGEKHHLTDEFYLAKRTF